MDSSKNQLEASHTKLSLASLKLLALATMKPVDMNFIAKPNKYIDQDSGKLEKHNHFPNAIVGIDSSILH